MKYRPKQYSKILATTLTLLLCANLFASPCKEKEEAVWKAVIEVEKAEKEYIGLRNVAGVRVLDATSKAVQDAIDATTGSRTRRGGSGQSEAAKALSKMHKAKEALEAARKTLENARTALQQCIDSHKCPACDAHYKKQDHFQESCETCNITKFYSCIHSCPGIPTCPSPLCNDKLTTELDKLLHKQVNCPACNTPYYLCNSAMADFHRPRICFNYNGFYSSSNNQWYHLYMGQMFKGIKYCHQLYRNCDSGSGNCTIRYETPESHNDGGRYNGSCPICSGIPILAQSCEICNQ